MPTVTEAIKRLKWAKGQHVALILWCEEDVVERAKERGVIMGHKYAAEIIDAVDHDQDCSTGFTWDTLDYYIDEFKREHPQYRRYGWECPKCGDRNEPEFTDCKGCGALKPKKIK